MALPHVRAILNRMARELGVDEAVLTRIGRETRDPFRVLISCLLSLRTRDETTDAASARLFARADNPKKMVKLSLPVLEKTIYPVGFYKTKARTIKKICGLLLKRPEHRVPDTMEALLALPGVGRKTANIVLVYGFNQLALPIDTHCHRIPNRIGWVRTRTADATEAELRKTLPSKYWPGFNDLLVRYGQQICKPVGPLCERCPITSFCERRGVKPGREK